MDDSITVIDFNTPFEKRVYYGTLIAAMAGVATVVVDLSERSWPLERVGLALVVLFGLAVVGLRVLNGQVDEHLAFDAKRRGLFRVRRVGPLRWEWRVAGDGEMVKLHVSWTQNENGTAFLAWVELEAAGGRRIPLTGSVYFRDASRLPPELAARAAELAALLHVPLEEWLPFSSKLGSRDALL